MNCGLQMSMKSPPNPRQIHAQSTPDPRPIHAHSTPDPHPIHARSIRLPSHTVDKVHCIARACTEKKCSQAVQELDVHRRSGFYRGRKIYLQSIRRTSTDAAAALNADGTPPRGQLHVRLAFDSAPPASASVDAWAARATAWARPKHSLVRIRARVTP